MIPYIVVLIVFGIHGIIISSICNKCCELRTDFRKLSPQVSFWWKVLTYICSSAAVHYLWIYKCKIMYLNQFVSQVQWFIDSLKAFSQSVKRDKIISTTCWILSNCNNKTNVWFVSLMISFLFETPVPINKYKRGNTPFLPQRKVLYCEWVNLTIISVSSYLQKVLEATPSS